MKNNALIPLFISFFLIASPQLATAQTIDKLYQQGITAYNDGNYSQAEAIWRKVLEFIPNDTTAHFYLGRSLYSQEKFDEAITSYEQAVQLNPNDVRAFIGLSVSLRELKKIGKAIVAYRKASQIDPKITRDSYADFPKLGKKFTRDSYADFPKLGNGYVNTYIEQGEALKKQGKFDEAIEAYKKAIKVAPKFFMAYIYLGDVLREKKKFDEAIKEYETVLKLPKDKSVAPISPDILSSVYNSLGLSYYAKGKLNEANRAFATAMTLAPSNLIAKNNSEQVSRKREERLSNQARIGTDDFYEYLPEDEKQCFPKDEPLLPIFRSVVLVEADSNNPNQLGPTFGAGIVINKGEKTLILTNSHIIFNKKQSKKIEVELYSSYRRGKCRQRYKATVLFRVPSNQPKEEYIDVAILEVTQKLPEDIEPLSISTSVQRGMSIKTIGHATHNSVWRADEGKITNYNNQEMVISLSNTFFKEGRSGSAIINSQNELLGIVYEHDKDTREGFAYPMSIIKEILRKFKVKAL